MYDNVYVTAYGKESPLPPPDSIKEVVLGRGFLIQNSAKLYSVSFGVNAKIGIFNHIKFLYGFLGKNANLSTCIFGDYVQIGDECVIEECIFENFVIIGNNVNLKNCFVGSNVP